ncbi:MAG: 23S rRNA (guanosine(2251)-2'-O)-methyltransferase RlmB [Panacagrimonas sp.]
MTGHATYLSSVCLMSDHYIGGFHAVLAALEDAQKKPALILLADSRNDDRAQRVRALAQSLNVEVRTAGRSDLDLKVPGLRHQGVLALVPATELSGEDVLEAPAAENRLFLALDGVQDPHNLGACLRTAEAAGASAVIVPRDRAASLTAVARKVAAGSAERVPVVSVTNLSRTLGQLKDRGYWLTGLAGECEETLFDVDLTGPLVLVLGAEGEGLRRLTRETCDRVVRIPMMGKAESLNVSAAAAVCLFEAFRQRRLVRR